jgi:hypothetical protein
MHVFAILRIDDFLGPEAPTEHRVTVTKVMRDVDAARREVERLNDLQGGDGVHYHMQVTRLERGGAVVRR